MDKYLKIFEPSMKKRLSERYSPEEAKARFSTVYARASKARSMGRGTSGG